MTGRVGPKGQVVIPKRMRDRLGLLPGDVVDFELDDGAVRVVPLAGGGSLRGSLAGLGLTGTLEEDHRRDSALPPSPYEPPRFNTGRVLLDVTDISAALDSLGPD